jgi:hypothetical protein
MLISDISRMYFMTSRPDFGPSRQHVRNTEKPPRGERGGNVSDV